MKNIRMKLFSTYAALILLTVALLGSGFTWYAREFYLDTVRNRLAEEARITGELIKPLLATNGDNRSAHAALDAYLAELASFSSTRITIVDADGSVLADSDEESINMDNHLTRPEIKSVTQEQPGSAIRYSNTVNEDMLYVAVPYTNEHIKDGYIRLALPLYDLNTVIRRVQYALLAGLLGVLAVTLGLSLKLSTSFTRPLEEMVDVAGRISQGDLGSRIYQSRQDELGELGSAINSMADSLQKKMVEISTGRDRLDAILSTMVDGIFVFDKDGKAVMANPAAEEMFGTSGRSWLGRRDLEIVRNAELHEKLQTVRRERHVLEHRIRVMFPQKRELTVTLVPVSTSGQEKSGVLAVFHDITHLRRLEEMRADFAANVTHELRTPLTAIRGFAETIHDSAYDDSESTRRFAMIIQREAVRLGILIDDVLTLSQIESGKTEILLSEVNLRSMLAEVMEMFTGRLDNHTVEINVEESVPPVYADKNLLRQALSNLLDNALKYTPHGGYVNVGAEEEGKNVRIFVRDNGIGIPQEAQKRIFERFYRVDRARSRRLGGTGLGLAIVKHIVEAHKGTLHLSSSEGKGTEVGITIDAVR